MANAKSGEKIWKESLISNQGQGQATVLLPAAPSDNYHSSHHLKDSHQKRSLLLQAEPLCSKGAPLKSLLKRDAKTSLQTGGKGGAVLSPKLIESAAKATPCASESLMELSTCTSLVREQTAIESLFLSQQVNLKTFLLSGGRSFQLSKNILDPPMTPEQITPESLRILSLRAPLLFQNHKEIWKYNANIASHYFEELKGYNLTNKDRENSIALLVKHKVFPFDYSHADSNIRWEYTENGLQCENRFITGYFQFLLARDLFVVKKGSQLPVRSVEDRVSGLFYLSLMNKRVVRDALTLSRLAETVRDNTIVWTCPETGDTVQSDNLLDFPHGYPWDDLKDQKVKAIDYICDHMDLPKLGTISKVRFLEWVSLFKGIPSSLEAPENLFTYDEDLSVSMVSSESDDSIDTSREMEILEEEINRLDCFQPQVPEVGCVPDRTPVRTLTYKEHLGLRAAVLSIKDQIGSLLRTSREGVCTLNRRYLRYCIHTLITNFSPNKGDGFKGPWIRRNVGRTDPQSYHRQNRDLKGLKELIGSVSRLKTAVA